VNDAHFESYRSTSGSRHLERMKSLDSYLFFGRYIASTLNDHAETQAYFPGREEIRASLNLLDAIVDEWEIREQPMLRGEKKESQPYYVHLTADVNSFTKSVVQGYAAMYEAIMFSRSLGSLNKMQEKIIHIFGSLLQSSFSSQNPREYSILRNESLFAEESKKRWGFMWLPTFLFDWSIPSLEYKLEQQFDSLDSVLRPHFPGRQREQNLKQDFLSEIDQVIQVLRKEIRDGFKPKHHLLCRWIAVKIMQQYMKEAWEGIYRSRQIFKGKRVWKRRLAELWDKQQNGGQDESQEEEESEMESVRLFKDPSKTKGPGILYYKSH
jgi:hypothetical protein